MMVTNLHHKFVYEYCKNFREVGSIVPDSKACIDALLRFVPFNSGRILLEYGAASGAVTREIISRKDPEAVLISFEKSSRFYAEIKKFASCQQVFLINDDMFNCARILAEQFGLAGKVVDCIISTLPCSFLDCDELIRTSVLPLLREQGVFIQYMHTLSLIRGFRLSPIVKKYFRRVNSEFVFRNLPPVYVYTCWEPRPAV